MTFYRVFTCKTPEQAQYRLRCLLTTTGLSRGEYRCLGPETIQDATYLDPRFSSNPTATSAVLKSMIEEGTDLYLFELWSEESEKAFIVC